MDPKTKREAERAIHNAEQGAARHRELASASPPAVAAKLRDWARGRDAEAARLRALSTTLPE